MEDEAKPAGAGTIGIMRGSDWSARVRWYNDDGPIDLTDGRFEATIENRDGRHPLAVLIDDASEGIVTISLDDRTSLSVRPGNVNTLRLAARTADGVDTVWPPIPVVGDAFDGALTISPFDGGQLTPDRHAHRIDISTSGVSGQAGQKGERGRGVESISAARESQTVHLNFAMSDGSTETVAFDLPADPDATAGAIPPQVVDAPFLTGAFEVGSLLTAEPGQWSGTQPIAFAYRWKRDGTDIDGVETSSYRTEAADAGAVIGCMVTAANEAGNATVLALNAATVRDAPTNEPSVVPTPASLVALGDSVFNGSRIRHWWAAASTDLGGRIVHLPSTEQGTGGDDSGDMLARVQTVVDASPEVVFVNNGQNEASTRSLSDIKADYGAIFTALSAVRRIFVAPFPPTRTIAGNAALQQRAAEMEVWLRDEAPESYSNVVLLEGMWDDVQLHDGAGGAGPHSYDGIHPNGFGGWLAGRAAARIAAPHLSTKTIYDDDTITNLHPADYTGTGGVRSGVAGEVADGLQLIATGSGASVDAAKGTLRGFPSQIISLTGTASAANKGALLREQIGHALGAAAPVGGAITIKVSATDGVSPPVGLTRLEWAALSGKARWGNQYKDEDWPALEGVAVAIPAPLGASVSGFNCDLTALVRAGEVDVRIEVARPLVYDLSA